MADLPGHLLVVLIVDKTGRRSLNAFFLFVGGVACIATTFIPGGSLTISYTYIIMLIFFMIYFFRTTCDNNCNAGMSLSLLLTFMNIILIAFLQAKIAMAGCFAVIYNYTAELFPTVVR